MAKSSLWSDEYWLLIMQLYLRKPVGVKPLYDKKTVDLSIELHIQPDEIFRRICTLANMDTPSVERLWETYGNNPNKLQREAKLLRQMNGFSNAESFYKDVELKETFEKDFKPLDEHEELKPVMLILILDLYFRLTPITMVAETPEIMELARLMKIKPSQVADIMELFQYCDPYLNREDFIINPLLLECQKIWNRFGNMEPERLESFASQLMNYFK
jgi:hypothetical protein